MQILALGQAQPDVKEGKKFRGSQVRSARVSAIQGAQKETVVGVSSLTLLRLLDARRLNAGPSIAEFIHIDSVATQLSRRLSDPQDAENGDAAGRARLIFRVSWKRQASRDKEIWSSCPEPGKDVKKARLREKGKCGWLRQGVEP
ncbi:unnamed protein product [Clonostachys rosea]|uniref:Uncharacterized protein n=1 Tax=Bionectria ochroleuca TaxID=29856 RepID=A0ABY6TNA8_BIOOC|nr:unnamed protein product [Clonostachys rosea]